MPFQKGQSPWNKGTKGVHVVYRIFLSDGTHYPPIPDLCHCKKRCNEITYGGKEFINGHNSIGKIVSEETRELMSKNCSMKRPEVSKKFERENNYNYKRDFTEEERSERSKNSKEWHKTHEHPRGMLGKTHSSEIKETESKLLESKTKIYEEAKEIALKASKLPIRKNQADYIMFYTKGKPKGFSGLCFNILDGRTEEVERSVWNIVRP